jgi:hypothetical protein
MQITSLRGSGGYPWRMGQGSAKSGAQKTRPSAQYAANDLARPDIEIGSRHPVNYILPRIYAEGCEPVHNKAQKVRGRALRSAGQGQWLLQTPAWAVQPRLACL